VCWCDFPKGVWGIFSPSEVSHLLANGYKVLAPCVPRYATEKEKYGLKLGERKKLFAYQMTSGAGQQKRPYAIAYSLKI